MVEAHEFQKVFRSTRSCLQIRGEWSFLHSGFCNLELGAAVVLRSGDKKGATHIDVEANQPCFSVQELGMVETCKSCFRMDMVVTF